MARAAGGPRLPADGEVDVHAARLVPLPARHHAAVALAAVLRHLLRCPVRHEGALALWLLAQVVARSAETQDG